MKYAWLYCRIEQPNSDAMQIQRNELHHYAEEHEYAVAGVTQEYGNGLSIDRFGLLDVARAVMDGKAIAVITKNTSRIARRSDELAQFIRILRRYGAALECVQEGTVDNIIPFPYRDFRQKKSECSQFL